MTALLVFFYYTKIQGNELTATKAFVTITVLKILQDALVALPNFVSKGIGMIISLKRIQKILDSEDVKPHAAAKKTTLKNCSFAYDKKITLTNISLELENSEFLAVVGPVGSGKSSLLLSILGELTMTAGKAEVCEDIAYTSSLDSWLLNTTFKENILMGRDFRQD